MNRPILLLLLTIVLSAPRALHAQAPPAAADDKKQPPVPVELAEGKLTMPAPAAWKKVEARNQIIEQEFAVAIKEVDAPARFTVMASGGTIQQNVDRWLAQFKNLKQPAEGKAGELHALEVDGMKAHWVDLSGVYLESAGGPFAPTAEKPDYRVLAAILETKDSGNYFFKLVGPEKVVAAHKDAFMELLKGVTAN